jgi:hypothetical protein
MCARVSSGQPDAGPPLEDAELALSVFCDKQAYFERQRRNNGYQ